MLSGLLAGSHKQGFSALLRVDLRVREMFKEKNRANAILRYGIRLSQGHCCKCPENTRFALILRLKDDLEKMGAKWQVKCLKWHLHKFQKEFVNSKNVKEGCLK